MIIYNQNLLRPELTTIPNDELISSSRFSQAKPSKLLPRLDKKHVKWMFDYGVGKNDLYTVHDPDYVDQWFARDPVTAEYALATVNAHAYAAKLALQYKIQVVTPVSGFHHASYDRGWGFCVFNGLMYSAHRLGVPVAIIDGDTHEGDGCINIIKHLNMKNVLYFSKERDYDQLLEEIPEDYLIFYQAGVDGHMEDPFGGTMWDEDYADREEILFKSKRPMVVNLAGGYTNHAIELHLKTIERFGYERHIT